MWVGSGEDASDCLLNYQAQLKLNLLDAGHVDRLHALVDFDEEAKSGR